MWAASAMLTVNAPRALMFCTVLCVSVRFRTTVSRSCIVPQKKVPVPGKKYVDDFLSYSIRSLSEGHDIESMCQELFVKECRWNTYFQKNNCQLDGDLITQMLDM